MELHCKSWNVKGCRYGQWNTHPALTGRTAASFQWCFHWRLSYQTFPSLHWHNRQLQGKLVKVIWSINSDLCALSHNPPYPFNIFFPGCCRNVHPRICSRTVTVKIRMTHYSSPPFLADLRWDQDVVIVIIFEQAYGYNNSSVNQWVTVTCITEH